MDESRDRDSFRGKQLFLAGAWKKWLGSKYGFLLVVRVAIFYRRREWEKNKVVLTLVEATFLSGQGRGEDEGRGMEYAHHHFY